LGSRSYQPPGRKRPLRRPSRPPLEFTARPMRSSHEAGRSVQAAAPPEGLPAAVTTARGSGDIAATGGWWRPRGDRGSGTDGRRPGRRDG
jgi:hypothetical protein